MCNWKYLWWCGFLPDRWERTPAVCELLHTPHDTSSEGTLTTPPSSLCFSRNQTTNQPTWTQHNEVWIVGKAQTFSEGAGILLWRPAGDSTPDADAAAGTVWWTPYAGPNFPASATNQRSSSAWAEHPENRPHADGDKNVPPLGRSWASGSLLSEGESGSENDVKNQTWWNADWSIIIGWAYSEPLTWSMTSFLADRHSSWPMTL